MKTIFVNHLQDKPVHVFVRKDSEKQINVFSHGSKKGKEIKLFSKDSKYMTYEESNKNEEPLKVKQLKR